MGRVYMKFERVLGLWRVSFTALGSSERLRDFTFSDGGKIEAMAEHAGALRDLAAKQGLQAGLRNGLGGIELKLTPEQFDKLKVSSLIAPHFVIAQAAVIVTDDKPTHRY